MKAGWEIKTLGDVSVMMADGPFGSNLKKEHYTENREVRIIQLSNIGEDGWREENTKYTTFKHLETIQRSEVFPNDIVIAKMMPAGRAIICPNHEKKFVLSSDAVKVQLKKGINLRFAWYSINSPYFRKQVYENVAGSGRVRTSLTKLKVCKLRLPSLPEQQRLVDILDQEFAKIDALKDNAEKSLQAAKDLFQATLRKELEPKEGWISEALSSICRVINGRAYSKEEFFEAGKYRVLRVGNFFTNDKWYYSNLELEEDKYCEQGDLLYAWSASFGPRIWLGEKVIYHYHIWKLVNKEDTIRKQFLYYWLMSPFFMSQTMNDLHGTTMVHITKGIMEQAIVSFPSVSVQDGIVREIEQASHLCSSLQENFKKTLTLCDDLKQALLRKAFNGEL